MVLLTALAAWVLPFFNVVPISSSSFSYSASSDFALPALCEACCRHYDLFEKSAFISYVEEHFFEDEWSLDVCAHRALKDGTFTREQIVCTKTLYGYADLGLLNIRNIDLPEKLHRSPKTAHGQPASKSVRSSDTERWTWSSGQKAVTMTHYLL